jgi:hypothetical protein
VVDHLTACLLYACACCLPGRVEARWGVCGRKSSLASQKCFSIVRRARPCRLSSVFSCSWPGHCALRHGVSYLLCREAPPARIFHTSHCCFFHRFDNRRGCCWPTCDSWPRLSYLEGAPAAPSGAAAIHTLPSAIATHRRPQTGQVWTAVHVTSEKGTRWSGRHDP